MAKYKVKVEIKFDVEIEAMSSAQAIEIINESFDVEVQYCNPDDCYLDCQDAANHCNYHFTTMF